ncbi:MAG: hypothetical protein IPF66_11800 [Holophagales bacterium]|nr:hypothetical protein [Holophagales bacterium]
MTTRQGKLQTAASSTRVLPGSGSPGLATQTMGPGGSPALAPSSREPASMPSPGPRRFAATHATASASPTSRTVKRPAFVGTGTGIGSGPASIGTLSSPADPAVYMRR